jgi:uracil-DNA glycosylase
MTSQNFEYVFNENLADNTSQLIACYCCCSSKVKEGNNEYTELNKKYPYVDLLSSRKEDSKPGTIKIFGDKKQGQRLVLLLFVQITNGECSPKDSEKLRDEWFDKSLEKISAIKGLKSIAFPYNEKYNSKIEKWSENNSSVKVYVVSSDDDPQKQSEEEEEVNLSDEESQKSEESQEECSESEKESSEEEEEDEKKESSEEENSSEEEEEPPAVAMKQKIEKLDSFIKSGGGFQNPVTVTVQRPKNNYGEDYEFLKWFWSEIQNAPYINPLYFINIYEKKDSASVSTTTTQTKNWSWDSSTLLEYTKNNIPKTFEPFFEKFIDGGGMDDISSFLVKEVKNSKIFPELPNIYKSFELCPLDKMKVVIIGQDPYHTEGFAMGVAFGHYPNTNRVQPSLKNIYKAVEKDGFKINWNNGDITKWCEQGVFCINTALTVREGEAGSHLAKSKAQEGPWDYFTRQLFNFLDEEKEHLVVMLWGVKAQEYKDIFSTKKHFLIMAPHPAASAHNPLNTEFLDANCFSKANRKLKTWNIEQIDWNLE